MEVMTCYKQTGFGVIPQNWKELELSDIVRNDAPICYGIVQVGSYARNGVTVLAIKNLNTDYVTEVHRASADVERSYVRSRIEPGDVLISVKGTTGRIGLVPQGFYGNISRDLARLRPREGFDPRFCYQMLLSAPIQRRLNTATVGTTRMELSIAVLKQVCIPFPPTEAEQEAIAEALSDADAFIDSIEKLIAKKRDLKQGVMQELLTGKKRLPEFRLRSGTKQTEVGVIPEDWEVRPVSTFGKVVTGGTPPTTERAYWGGEYAWVTPTDISDHRDIYTSERCITESGLATLRALPANTVLITCIASIGKNAVLKTVGACNQQINAVSPNHEHSAEFLYYVFESSKAYLLANAGMTATSIISKATFQRLVFPLPPTKAEQEVIATILSDMDAEISSLEAKLAKARQVKQGMMHNLLTGRIRLV